MDNLSPRSLDELLARSAPPSSANTEATRDAIRLAWSATSRSRRPRRATALIVGLSVAALTTAGTTAALSYRSPRG